MSQLLEHAQREMRLAGLYDDDSDYGGMIPEAVEAMVKAHSDQGHSGGSHWVTMGIFNEVIEYKTLTPLTDSPAEWMHIEEDVAGNAITWQSRRRPDAFSSDGGKTYYLLDEPRRFRWLPRAFRKPRMHDSLASNPDSPER